MASALHAQVTPETYFIQHWFVGTIGNSADGSPAGAAAGREMEMRYTEAGGPVISATLPPERNIRVDLGELNPNWTVPDVPVPVVFRMMPPIGNYGIPATEQTISSDGVQNVTGLVVQSIVTDLLAALVESFSIVRVGDAPGAAVRLSWSAPAGSAVSAFRKVNPFATAAELNDRTVWAEIPGQQGVVTPGAGTYSFDDGTAEGIIRQGAGGTSQAFYKIIPDGGDFATGPIVGRIDVPLSDAVPSAPVSFPFVETTRSIQDAFGNQLTGDTYRDADKVFTWDDSGNLQEAWLDGGGTWRGSLANITTGKGYWLDIRPGHPRTTISFVGRVNRDNQNLALRQGPNFIGWSYPLPTTIQDSGLRTVATSGTYGSSDKVHTWNAAGGLLEAWYSSAGGGTWTGALTTLDAPRGYWFSNGVQAGAETWTLQSPIR